LRNGVGRIEDFAVDAPLFDFQVRTEIGRWEVCSGSCLVPPPASCQHGGAGDARILRPLRLLA
jgi:hypothetical protein